MAINNQMVEWCGLYHFTNLAGWRHFPCFHRDFFCRSKYQAVDGVVRTRREEIERPTMSSCHAPVVVIKGSSRSQKHWTIKTAALSFCLLILGYILICRVAAKWYFHVFSNLAKENHTFHHYPKKSAFPITWPPCCQPQGAADVRNGGIFGAQCPHDISQWKRKMCGKRMQDGAPKIAKLPCKWLNYGLW